MQGCTALRCYTDALHSVIDILKYLCCVQVHATCSVKFEHFLRLQVALGACREAAGNVEEIAFILFSQDTFDTWKEAAEGLKLQPV